MIARRQRRRRAHLRGGRPARLVGPPAARVDVLVSNATLQWVPGHLELLPRLLAGVRPGGWFACQVPGNFAEPSHKIRRELAAEPAYAAYTAGVDVPASHEPEVYLAALRAAGCDVGRLGDDLPARADRGRRRVRVGLGHRRAAHACRPCLTVCGRSSRPSSDGDCARRTPSATARSCCRSGGSSWSRGSADLTHLWLIRQLLRLAFRDGPDIGVDSRPLYPQGYNRTMTTSPAKSLLVLGGGTAGTMAANKLHKRLPGLVGHRRRPGRHPPLPARLPVHPVRRSTRPTGPQDQRHVPRRRRRRSSSARSTGSTPTHRHGRCSPTAARSATTTWSSPPAPRRAPTRPRACSATSGARASTTSTPTRARSRWPRRWQTSTGGRLVVHIAEMPIKCPVAPLEFAFLADATSPSAGMRDQVEHHLRDAAGRRVHQAGRRQRARRRCSTSATSRSRPTSWSSASTTSARRSSSYDEREVPFDLLVTVPLNMGADFVARSGLGDELNYVPVDKHTLLSTEYDEHLRARRRQRTSRPRRPARSRTSRSTSSSTTSSQHVAGQPMTDSFDGHANCFVESGDGKALLIDFNYDTEPLPGKYPLPRRRPASACSRRPAPTTGQARVPLDLLERAAARPPVPLPARMMSMAGKHPEDADHPSTREGD